MMFYYRRRIALFAAIHTFERAAAKISYTGQDSIGYNSLIVQLAIFV